MFVYVESSAPMRRSNVNPNSNEEVAKRLILLRKALDYTPAFIAKLCGVTVNAWYNYENADRRPRYDVMVQIEIMTGAPTEWIDRGIMARMMPELIQKIELAKREIERERRKGA